MEVQKALSDFHSTIFEFPNTVQGQTQRQAKDENRKWCGGLWHTRVADSPVLQCDVELLTKCIKKLRKHKSSPDGVTAEIFNQLSSTQLEQLAQSITDRFTTLDFRDTMDHSRSELVSQNNLSEQIVRIQADLFPVDDEENAWLRLAGSNRKHTVQLVPNGLSSQDRRFARSFCLGETAKEWQAPLFLAQLDLKHVFDHVQHSFATTAQQQEGPQSSCSGCSTNGGSRATLKSAWPVPPVRGLQQGALESPAIFVVVSDHVLGIVDAGWRNRNIGWKMDNIHLTSIAYADDIWLLASSKKDLEFMVKECIDGFLAAGLEKGLDKTSGPARHAHRTPL